MKRIDETRLTDYVMGELDEASRIEVEAAMAEDEQLRAQCEELQATLSLLKEPQLQPVLGNERREALRAAAQGSEVGSGAGKGRVLQFPVMKMAAALLVFGGAIVIVADNYGGYGPTSSESASLPHLGAGVGYSGGQSLEAMGYVGKSDGFEAESEESLTHAPFLEELGYAPSPEDLAALGYGGGGGGGFTIGQDAKAGNERGTYKGPGDVNAPVAPGAIIMGSKGASSSGGLRVLDLDGFDQGTGDATVGRITHMEAQPSAEIGVGVYSLQPSQELTANPQGVDAEEMQLAFDAAVVPLGGDPAAGLPNVPSTPSTPAKPATPSSPASPGAAPVLDRKRDGLRDKLKEEDLQSRGLGNDSSNDSLEFAMEELESLGYVADDGSSSESEFRARNRWYTQPDGDARGRREQPLEPICTLTDGYGRRYVDAQVIEHLRPIHDRETPQDMFFRFYGDNPEVFTRFDALSTFAADVDTASYPMARNYLVHDQLPPKGAIRTEEFLNYFDYGLPAPTEDDFTVHLNASQTAFGDDRLLVSVGLKAREVEAADRKPMNLVFVLDKSGSMAGERMQLVKDALMMLVDQIRDTDTIGLVTFDSTGHVVLEPTPGTERYRIRKAIRELSTGGSTNAGQGLELGYGLMEKVYDPTSINRVVLASDGVANTGETDQARILKNVTERAEARVDLTTLGVGMGNHNDVFLEQLADQGNGSCHYLDDIQEAERVLVEGFLGTMITVARDVKIQVEFEEEQVLRWRQLGYENRSLAHQDFRNDAVDAGEVGSGHEVVALYEVQTAKEASPEGNLVTVRLRWKPEGSDKAVERSFQLDLAAASGRWALAPVRLRQQAVIAQYAEVLRRSVHSRTDSYAQLMEEAERLSKELSGETEVAELRDMIRRTRDLARWTAPDDRISMLVEEARRQRLLEAELAMAAEELDVEELLEQVRQQNRSLEGQLQEILQRD